MNSINDLGHSPDARAQRQAELTQALAQIAPEIISDQQVNIEALKELLGQEYLAPANHYELTWAGKTQARREIQKTTANTLAPKGMIAGTIALKQAHSEEKSSGGE